MHRCRAASLTVDAVPPSNSSVPAAGGGGDLRRRDAAVPAERGAARPGLGLLAQPAPGPVLDSQRGIGTT